MSLVAVVKKVSQTPVCGMLQLTCQIANLFFMIELLHVNPLQFARGFYQEREVTLLDLFICCSCMPCANVILGKLDIHKGVFMTSDTTVLMSSAFRYAGCAVCYQICCSLETLLSLFLEMRSA